ncbi:MAG: hypothetical protein HOD40_03795 [Chloroflexi bacterium]|nr:hypothetical protein [Chloroflexota bacterium]
MSEIERQAIDLSYPSAGIALIKIQSEPLGVLRFGVKQALQKNLAELENDNKTRCIILTGSEKSFSVGSDVRDFSTEVGWLLENDYIEAGLNAAIEKSPLPIIAAVNGFAFGGGAVLSLACDIRIASETAKFGFPEVKVGAFASGSGTQRLPRIVGRGRALDLLFTGRTIDANEALEIGLVEFVFPEELLLVRAIEYAKSIAKNSSSGIAATKRSVIVGLNDGIEAGLAEEKKQRVLTGRGKDAQEGRNAFLEKRDPNFS